MPDRLRWRPIFRHLRRCHGLRRPTFRLSLRPTTGAASISAAILALVGTRGGSVSDTFGSTFSGSGQTTKFLGGGQVGVNYEFYGGVVIGAEAMFDWLPNTTNTFNATEGAAARFLVPLPRRRSTIDG